MQAEEREGLIGQVVGLLMQYTWAGRKQFVSHLGDHGLTPPQFYTLAFLVGHRGDGAGDAGCPIHVVAEAVHQERATMTGIVDRLERAGLLERRRSQVDRRKWLVMPTAEGRRLIDRAGKAWYRQMVRAFDELDDSELARFHDMLQRLVEATTSEDMSRLPMHVFAGDRGGTWDAGPPSGHTSSQQDGGEHET